MYIYIFIYFAIHMMEAPIAKTDGAPVVAPKELTPGELSTLSKEERGAYHAARRAAAQTQELVNLSCGSFSPIRVCLKGFLLLQ